jgi:glutathione S-transferase
MLTLYHNAISTCSQKVRLTLAEKEIEFDSKPIDLLAGQQHDPDYVKLNPKHVVPTLVDDGKVILDSTVIVEYLDACKAENSLIPADPYGQARMRLWMKRVDDELHGKTTGVFTHAILTRKVLGNRSEEELEAYFAGIPDSSERDLRRILFSEGINAPQFVGAVERMSKFLDDMEATLSESKWLVGNLYTLADVSVIPYIFRLDNARMDGFWRDGRRPHVERWLNDMKARPSFDSAIQDWLPKELLGALHAFGEMVRDDVECIISDVEKLPRH